MKISHAIEDFTNKYNCEMIEAIDDMSKQIGYRENGYKMDILNVVEAIDKFKTFIEGYGEYKIKNINNPNATDNKMIEENACSFICDLAIHKAEVPYSNFPEYIKSYCNGIIGICETIDCIKCKLECEGVDTESVGLTECIGDKFISVVQPLFYSAMDQMVIASGYAFKQRLAKPDAPKEKMMFV